MTIRSAVHLIEPALHALALDDLPGFQLYDAGQLAGWHHPPLNPDLIALVTAAGTPDFAAIQKTLLNQYPGTHPVHLVRFAESSPDSVQTVEHLTLDTLDRSTASDGAWTVLIVPPLPQASSFERFQETIAHLRAPGGCPWDRKQTHTSLRPYLLEEAYEVLDALDTGNTDALREELGDLLLQIVLHSQIAVDTGEFQMPNIIAAINTKLVRRHPHVWGDVAVDGEQDVKVNWDRLKQAEKNEKTGEHPSRLDGVPKSLPALSQAFTYQDRAARVHFDWETIDPVIDKIREELEELLTAEDAESRAKEAGDLLFAVVNLARWLNVEPESALRGANARFYRRFNYIEQQATTHNRELEEMPLAEMDALWDDAKANGL